MQIAREHLASEDCEDRPIDENWLQTWDGYLPALVHTFGTDVYSSSAMPFLEAMVASMKSGGCPTLKVPQFRNLIGSQSPWHFGRVRHAFTLVLTV